MYLVRTDPSGNELWNKTYGSGEPGYVMDISILPDDDMILAGVAYTESGIAKACVIMTDASGKELWEKTYGGMRKDEAHFVAPTNDGGFIVAGYTQSFGDQNGNVFTNGTGDAWLVKIDGQGNEQWNKTYGGDAMDDAYYVIQSTDGGYLLGGTTLSFSNDTDRAYIVKTDSLGNEQWDRIFGNNSSDAIYAIEKAAGGYVLAGTMYPQTGDMKTFLVKIDDGGNRTWGYSYGENDYYNGYSICNADDGGYMIAGTKSSTTNNDGFIFKVNADGTAVMVDDNTTNVSPTNSSISPISILLVLVVIACIGAAVLVIWKWILKR